MKYWIILLVLTSCGSAHKLRKAERLIAKAEELGATWRVDTIHDVIKVPVPEVFVKEVHHAPLLDTVEVFKDRLKVKVVRMPGDSIFVEAECETDTITVEVPVTVTKTIEAKGGIPWWWIVIAGLVGAGVVGIIRR